MERDETDFQIIMNSYRQYHTNKQPVVVSYLGFFIIRLYDLLYEDKGNSDRGLSGGESNEEKVLNLLRSGPKGVKELQEATNYLSKSHFLKDVINKLIDEGKIERIGNKNSPNQKYAIKSVKYPL